MDFRRHLVPIFSLIASVCPIPPGHCQTTVPAAPDEYVRKTVFFIPRLTPQSATAQELNQHMAYVEDIVFNPRFNVMRLPEWVEAEIVNEGIPREEDGWQRLASIVQSCVTDSLHQLSKAYVTESEAQGFHAGKARESGVGEAALRKTFDSVLLGVPFISCTRASESEAVRLVGGIRWYSLQLSPPPAKLVGSFVTEATSSDSYTRMPIAMQLLAESIDTAMKSHPAFQMRLQVLDVGGGRILLTGGRSEGMRLDDRYEVFERVEGGSSLEGKERVGWVRIRKLHDPEPGRLVLSEAVRVQGGAVRPGMTLHELPGTPLEVSWSLEALPIRVGAGRLSQDDRTYVEIVEPQSTAAMVGAFGGTWNVGPYVGWPMVFLAFRAQFGGALFKSSHLEYSPQRRFSYVWGGEGGVCKRLYYRDIGVEVAVYGGGLLINQLSDSLSSHPDIRSIDTEIRSSGFSAEAGLSLQANPSVTLQLLARKRWYDTKQAWRLKVNGDKMNPVAEAQPEVDLGRWAALIQIKYWIRGF